MFSLSDFSLPVPNFEATYECFSMSMLPGNERLEVQKGGKIIMPPSALETLTSLNVSYPMLFKLLNNEKERSSHAGVLEFIADEGKCYLPYWMMDNLLLDEGGSITIQNVSLPIATYSKFQPHSSDFLDITNPKAVLENALRTFACLTKGDIIAIQYNHKIYELCVLKTQPGNAVSIIECDMNVEFEAPMDSLEPSQSNNQELTDVDSKDCIETFVGSGVRLDGKKKKETQIEQRKVKRAKVRGVPDYECPFGVLKFDRSIKPFSHVAIDKSETIENVDSKGFHGNGFSIKSDN